MSRETKEEKFWDDLVAVVDGEPAALEAYGDLLANSLEHRDARFEAEHAVRRLHEAGADWEHPADLDDRIAAAIRAQASGFAAPKETGPAKSGVQAKRFVEEPAAAGAPRAAHAPKDPLPRGRAIWLAVGISAAAAIALVAGGVALLGPDGGAGSSVVAPALSARLSEVARASAEEGASGVSVRAPGAEAFAPIAGGAQIAAGATVRTDDRTRASLALSDGSVVVLNHGTELTLELDAPRSLTLASGELVADVAHLDDGSRARIATPNGAIEVLGTKFLLAVAEEATTVRVTRGAVMMHPLAGEPMDVKAGEEGQLSRGRTATVTPAMEMASAIGWSELAREPAEGPVAGLGELRARRPGEREDRERPLALAEQKVDVRIVGNVARTEIEQTFENEGSHVLEGIYRFPLPPDARIASLALEVDGEWEQGAFVSRDRAQRIWRGVIRNATPVRARVHDEEFIWVPGPWRDPALLEWQRGGRFELRIFPIPARGARSVRLTYTQNVGPSGAGRRYVYPLPHSADGSTRVGRFSATVRVSGADPSAPPVAHGYAVTRSNDRGSPRLSFEARDFVPAGDLIVDYRLANEGADLRYWTYAGEATVPPAEQSREGEPDVAEAQRAIHEDTRGYVAFAIRPELPAWGRGEARDYVLVLDASQSMFGERWERASRLATGIVAEMDRRDRFMVLACDAICEPYEPAPAPPSAAAAERLGGWLEAVRPAGASDMVRALREGAEALAHGRRPDRMVHVIYVGDGMPSVGHRRPAAIAAEVAELATDPRLSFSTVGIGGDADALVLTAVARAGGGHHVPYVSGQRASTAALAVLETTFGAALEHASVRMPDGLTDVAPRRLPTIRAGQEVIVVGRLGSSEVRGDVVLSGRVGDEPFEARYPVTLTASTSAGNAFVPRQWAAATIDELSLSGKASDEPRIVALSKAFGVMSRHTSLLVLESEAMFRAFGVDRAQPAVEWSAEDAMEEGQSEGYIENARSGGMGTGHAASDRRWWGGTTPGDGEVDPLLDQSLGGGFGLRGTPGGGGSGVARGREHPASRDSVGALSRRRGNVTPASPNVMGSIDRTVIQRVIRSQLGALRACYEREQMRQPDLAGRLSIEFTIDPTGTVGGARVGSSSLGSSTVEVCVLRPVHRMRFPAPAGGGSVRVSYPLVFQATGGDRGTETTPPVAAEPPPPRRGGQWMRREWFSVGTITEGGGASRAEMRRVEAAESALAESPDSRDRHRALSRALSRARELDRARTVIEAWIARDQLDPEALTALADAIGRSGDRARALRLLLGTVDLRPDDTMLHERLARAFERTDERKRACAHRISLAEIRPDDVDAVAAAVRCERALARDAAASRLLADVEPETRRAEVERRASEAPEPERARGAITLEATWTGETDLDLTLVAPDGARLSFMGGTRGVVGTDASAIGRESLGLLRARSGSYLVEIARTDPADTVPASGTIRVQVAGERRTLPFRLDAETHVVVARADVERRQRIVPVR